MYQPIAQFNALVTANTPQVIVMVGEEADVSNPEPFRVWVLGGLLSSGEQDCYFESISKALEFAAREVSIALCP